MVLIVLSGGLGTLDVIINTLEKARPVIVIAESGGAASDIYRYCCPESDTYLELQKVGSSSRHDEEYVAACARLLPEIEVRVRVIGDRHPITRARARARARTRARTRSSASRRAPTRRNR